MRIRNPSYLYSLLLVIGVFLFASCKTSINISTMSETIVGQTAKTLRKAAKTDHGVSRSENIVLLGRRAAVYRIVLAEGIPDLMVQNLTEHINTRVSEMPFYSPVRSTSDLEAFFKKNITLNQLNSTYIDSLARVSVSNKDILNRLGKALEIDNLLVFQIDHWPCAECTAPLKIRIKLRAIDLPTGMIIWTGINELEVELPVDATYERLFALTEELLNRFQHRFERKWHRKRFQNLTLLAQN